MLHITFIKSIISIFISVTNHVYTGLFHFSLVIYDFQVLDVVLFVLTTT